MRIRLSVLAVLGTGAIYAPLLSAQIAAEPTPSSTFPGSTVLVVGALVAAGLGIWIFMRMRQPVDRRTVTPPSVDEPPRVDPVDVVPKSSRPAGGRTIFISYRRADSADITGRIYDRLTERFGEEHVYKDVDSVPLGVDFRKHIGDLVQRCDAVIAIIGNQWVSSQAGGARRLEDSRDLVRIEIAAALARGIPVVPVLVGGAVMPTEQELPAEMQGLAYRNGISVRPDPDFHKDLDRLIAGIDAHFGKR
jgi:hypothetical protein